MKLAYFDCQFGAAGDMLNAALLAAGLDAERWQQEVQKIALPAGSFSLRISDVIRCGIACKKLDVIDAAGAQFDAQYLQEPAAEHHCEHGHVHEHHHEHHDHEHHHRAHRHHEEHHHHHHHHHHEHQHEQAHHHEHEGGDESGRGEHECSHGRSHHDNGHGDQHGHHQHHRRLQDILTIIEKSHIDAKAKMLAAKIFDRLARAESQVHGVSPDDVHFHEVGSIDAIVDIVGFAIGYQMLGIERSVCSAVALGSGKVKMEHGVFPAPGPATVYLLTEAKAAVAPSQINFECLTPTGAAILCEIASAWGNQPAFTRLDCAGYGGGTKDPDQWPNVCRVLIGESAGTESGGMRFDSETIAVIEANIDDMNPQVLSFAVDKLFEAGALDVSLTPILMKKGRAAQLLTVLCSVENRRVIEETILTHTSTIGVRSSQASRSVAKRQWKEVVMESGDRIRIKLAYDNDGKMINAQPEYDDCAAFAAKHNVPLKDVLNQSMARFLSDRAELA